MSDERKPVLVGTIPGSLTWHLLRRMEEIDLDDIETGDNHG